jgi:hypothetical protein
MRRKRWFAWGAGLAVMALVFASYLRPDFVVSIANQVWACF